MHSIAQRAADALTPSQPRLLIRPMDVGMLGRGFISRILNRWHWMAEDTQDRRGSPPMGLAIDDLRGVRLFACDDALSPIDVPLPTGTYHVSVWLGAVRRRYTVTLQQDATFELRVRLRNEPP